MSVYLKAAIGTLFLALTLGAMGEVMIWGVLSLFHANMSLILSGEAIGAMVLLALAVPLFRLIVRNERSRGTAPLTEDVASVTPRPKAPKGPKPTAFV